MFTETNGNSGAMLPKVRGRLNAYTMDQRESDRDPFHLAGKPLYAEYYVFGIDKVHIGNLCQELPEGGEDKVYWIFRGFKNPGPFDFKCVEFFLNKAGTSTDKPARFWAAYDANIFAEIGGGDLTFQPACSQQ